jgi:G3E family GTPase
MPTMQHQSEADPGPSRRTSQGSPIFLIGGALGSGKTTLLKHLLAHQAGRRSRRPAVLVNEIGQADVNGLALHDGNGPDRGFDLHVVRSHCSCCDLRPALSERLRSVLVSADGAIFIEATGFGRTGELAETVEGVLAGGAVSPAPYLASVIAVLDARELVGSRLLSRAYRQEIAAADAVVVNKIDLVVGQRGVDQFLDRVRSVKAEARVWTASHGRVPPAQLLRVEPPRPGRANRLASAPATANALVSATAQLLGPVVVPRLQRLLARRRRDLVRVQGFVRTRGAPGLHELQWVPDTMDLRPRRSSEGVRSELVIVGHPQLDWEWLATELDRCIETDPADMVTEAAV